MGVTNCVCQKDGTLRPCVDYRRVNEVTDKDEYPLPVTSDCLDCLNCAIYMSSLDLQSGYWQIEMDEKDRAKTALTSRHGLYEYRVMPFCLTNAPGTFQRCMEIVFRGLILFNNSFDSHLENLTKFLKD